MGVKGCKGGRKMLRLFRRRLSDMLQCLSKYKRACLKQRRTRWEERRMLKVLALRTIECIDAQRMDSGTEDIL